MNDAIVSRRISESYTYTYFNKNNLYFIANYVKYYQYSMQCI